MILLALPLFRNAVTPLLKAMITQTWFALGETILALSNHLSVFHRFQHVFQDDLFHGVTGSKDEHCWSVVPRVLLIIFLKICAIFCFLQSVGLPPDCHDVLKVTQHAFMHPGVSQTHIFKRCSWMLWSRKCGNHYSFTLSVKCYLQLFMLFLLSYR